jgi:GT2 family glycosyltransferase
MDLRLLVIVLCHDGIELTLECLRSLEHQAGGPYWVLVVDSASQDRTAEIVRREFPGVEVIRSEENVGYAAGNNIGLRYGVDKGAGLFLLLNNDTLLERDCLKSLLTSAMSHPQAGMLGPMVYTWGEGLTISSAGGRIDWDHADAVNIGAGEADKGQYGSRPVDFLNGCGLLVTREAVEKAGLLDDRYFMYWEETDWCTRVRRAGLELRFEPRARMRHKAPIRPIDLGPLPLYYMTRNRLLFFSTHAHGYRKLKAFLHAWHGAWLGSRRERKQGRKRHARAIEQALSDAARHRWGRLAAATWAIDRQLAPWARPPATE